MTHAAPLPVTPRTVREARSGRPAALVHAGWASSFPWLVQGTTVRGRAEDPFDLGLFSGASPEARVRERWEELRSLTGMRRVVHARQVHGRAVRSHDAGGSGLDLAEPCDGHVTDRPDVLLAVTTADCVPVFVVDPPRRAIGLVHAGWRGAAAGILEEAVAAMGRGFASAPSALHVHFGPAICGRCYEVGPEVFEALGRPVPDRPSPLDLRAVLAARASTLGVPATQLSVSAHCTRCTGSDLFSHRAGDGQRQAGFLGVRGRGAAEG